MHPWLAHLQNEYVVHIDHLDIWICYSNTGHRSNLNRYVRETSSGMSTNLLFIKIIFLKRHSIKRQINSYLIPCIDASSYSIWCCKAYVIQKRSESLSFGIGYEHFVSTVLVSIRIAVFHSYIYLQKVIKSYLVGIIYHKYIAPSATLIFILYTLQYHRTFAFHGAHRVCQAICCN